MDPVVRSLNTQRSYENWSFLVFCGEGDRASTSSPKRNSRALTQNMSFSAACEPVPFIESFPRSVEPCSAYGSFRQFSTQTRRGWRVMKKGRSALSSAAVTEGWTEPRSRRISEFDSSLEGDHAGRTVSSQADAQQSGRRGDRAGQRAKAGFVSGLPGVPA